MAQKALRINYKGLIRFPREGNGTLLQYSCLENPMDGGAWWAAISGVAQSQTRLKRLSNSSIRFPLLTSELHFLRNQLN